MKMTKLLLLFVLFAWSGNLYAQLNNEPDEIETENGTLTIHPVIHGTVVFEWNDKTIYVDPYGGSQLFESFDDPDLILITHAHGDHLNFETLEGLNTENTTFVIPESVLEELNGEFHDQITVLANGESVDEQEVSIMAVPMYNLPEEDARHPKGWGNGYVLTLGGKNVYISGDTEDIPEMRGLTGIDIAFVCMNLPYTMDIKQAASAVLEFEPSIVYPYHHRGQDIQQFKELVDVAGKEIEVRLKDWYSGN